MQKAECRIKVCALRTIEIIPRVDTIILHSAFCGSEGDMYDT